MEYRGIKLADSVKLYIKNGEYNKQVKQGLDKLVELLEKNNHILLSEFKNNTTKIVVDFNCGHEPTSTLPSNYTRGQGCMECGKLSSKKKLNGYSEAKLRKMIESNNHKLLSEYKGDKVKVLVDFNCGHKPHEIAPTNYKRGKGCPKCKNMCPEQAVEELNNLLKANGDIWLDGEYISTHTKILIKFNCEHEANWVTPAHYKTGNGCYDCGVLKNTILAQERSKSAKEEFKELVKQNGHELLSEYKRATWKVLIDYKCKHEPHWVSPNAYKTHDVGCPRCKESKGEKIIQEWLKDNNLEFKTQYKFPLYKNKRKGFKYDLMLPNDNLIIEIHGGQHYFEVDYFKMSLAEVQANDKAKRELAESLGYKYLVVDYREGKPKLALERFKKQYNAPV